MSRPGSLQHDVLIILQVRVPMLASSLDRNEIAIVSPKSITSGQMSARATFSGVVGDKHAVYALSDQTTKAPY